MFFNIRGILILLCAVVGMAFTGSVRAENLNQKYGPSWDCSYITVGMPIYDACKPCQDQKLDFFRDTDTTGHCVPRDGADAQQEITPTPQIQPPAQQTLQPAPPKPRVQYTIRVCNKTNKGILAVALGTNEQIADVMHLTMRGWYSVANGGCRDVAVRDFGNFDEMPFIIHAQAGNNYWPEKVWPSNEDWSGEEWMQNRNAKPNVCVDPLNAFNYYADPPASCTSDKERAFIIEWVEKTEGASMVVKEVDFQ